MSLFDKIILKTNIWILVFLAQVGINTILFPLMNYLIKYYSPEFLNCGSFIQTAFWFFFGGFISLATLPLFKSSFDILKLKLLISLNRFR